MILVTHAVVGGAIGVAIQNPILAFTLGFLTHFAFDTIPHWDYHLKSRREDPSGDKLKDDMIIGRDFVFDVIKIAVDFFGGLALAYIFFSGGFDEVKLGIIFGALGGM